MTMSWSYSGDPNESRLDMVRFRIGATNQKSPITLSNEEIQFCLDENANDYLAAEKCCEALVAKYVDAGMLDKADSLRKTCKELHTTFAKSVGPQIKWIT